MHRCSQRGRRDRAGGPSPLPPCGQLTRCFSAVAELLVVASCGIEVNHAMPVKP